MTTPFDGQLDDRLLAYHMDWLEPRDRAEVEQLIESSPEIAARSREIEQTLSPLADWNAMPVVPDLEQQVLHRIQREVRASRTTRSLFDIIRFKPISSAWITAWGRFPLSLRESLIAAACLVILGSILVPGMARASAWNQRTHCAGNLSDIGQGLVAYGADYQNRWPFIGPQGATWRGESPDSSAASRFGNETVDVQPLRNSQNRFLLLAHRYVDGASRFVCPTDPLGIVMRADDYSQFRDFAEPRNCSYDSQIMVSDRNQASVQPQLVVYADPNPVFSERNVRLANPAELNSPLHRHPDGQNVLRADGSTQWTRSPRVGIDQDNIWRIEGMQNYSGRDIPRFSTDSFMIP